MRQRLGLAATLLGNPRVLILDEPANGLDPEGIRWLRGFLRSLADEGRTILVSSHLLAEVEQTVDDVVIIAAGQSVRQGKVADLRSEQMVSVRVRTPQVDELVAALDGAAGAPRRPRAALRRRRGRAVGRQGRLRRRRRAARAASPSTPTSKRSSSSSPAERR